MAIISSDSLLTAEYSRSVALAWPGLAAWPACLAGWLTGLAAAPPPPVLCTVLLAGWLARSVVGWCVSLAFSLACVSVLFK